MISHKIRLIGKLWNFHIVITFSKSKVKWHVLTWKQKKLCQITSLSSHSVLFKFMWKLIKTKIMFFHTSKTEKFCQITSLWIYFHMRYVWMLNDAVWQKICETECSEVCKSISGFFCHSDFMWNQFCRI